MFLVC